MGMTKDEILDQMDQVAVAEDTCADGVLACRRSLAQTSRSGSRGCDVSTASESHMTIFLQIDRNWGLAASPTRGSYLSGKHDSMTKPLGRNKRTSK
jgi:hypothetical protein